LTADFQDLVLATPASAVSLYTLEPGHLQQDQRHADSLQTNYNAFQYT
jgi:hypothetical protein